MVIGINLHIGEVPYLEKGFEMGILGALFGVSSSDDSGKYSYSACNEHLSSKDMEKAQSHEEKHSSKSERRSSDEDNRREAMGTSGG